MLRILLVIFLLSGFVSVSSANGNVLTKTSQSVTAQEKKIRNEFNNYSTFKRKYIQEMLKSLSLYNGPVDGVWGGKTQKAVLAYADSEGILPSNATWLFTSIVYSPLVTLSSSKSFSEKTDTELCWGATTFYQGVTSWNSGSNYSKELIIEAKSRGLDCDVVNVEEESTQKPLTEAMIEAAVLAELALREEALKNQKEQLRKEAEERLITEQAKSLRDEFNKIPFSERKLIQHVLKQLSGYNGPIDGVWGEKTREAVYSFGNSPGITLSNAKVVFTHLLMLDKFSKNQTASVTDDPISCPTGENQLKDNCFASFTTEEGHKVSGYFRNNKLNGHGTISYSNGNIYKGEWVDSELQGQGTYTYGSQTKSAGDRYVGQFKKSRRHGQGTYTHSDGNKYTGEWKDGKPHGRGKLAENGKTYVGEFKEGKISGQGTFSGDGKKVIGEFKENEVVRGTKIFPNGAVYQGEFKNNEFHGRGTYTWENGDIYQGEWKDGKKHGRGLFSDRDYAGGQFFDTIWENGTFQNIVGQQRPQKSNKKFTFLDALAALAMGAAGANSSASQTQNIYQQPNTNFTQPCFLTGDYVSGFNKVCNYSCGLSAYAETINSTSICPFSVNR